MDITKANTVQCIYPQKTQDKLNLFSSANLIEKNASLVEFIMSWARSIRRIGEDEYGEQAPDLNSSFFWYNFLHHTRYTHQALLLESFLHGFKVWSVSAILAFAYYLRILPHSINQSPDMISNLFGRM